MDAERANVEVRSTHFPSIECQNTTHNGTEKSCIQIGGKSVTNICANPAAEHVTSILVGQPAASATYPPQDDFINSLKRLHAPHDDTTSDRFESTVVLQPQNGWMRASTPNTYDIQLDMKERPAGDTWSVCSKPTLASLPEDPPSLDDGERSTSTLVRPGSSKVSFRDRESQKGFTAFVCGASIVMGAAVFLRLPGLITAFGPGPFLSAFVVCLLLVAVPLGFLEAGLGQFSSNGVIGMWSLVPFARGVGWSAVVVCLYWGATAVGMGAPWLHYMFAYLKPDMLPVSNENCSVFANTTSPLDYYRDCVYNYNSAVEGALVLRLTWPLPAGMAIIMLLAIISVLKGPILFASVSGIGCCFALAGCVTQLVVAFCEATATDGHQILFQKILSLLVPKVDAFLEPELWMAAMTQSLITLGCGIGVLISHSSKNVFRFPLKRKLLFLTTLALLLTLVVALTTLLQIVVISNQVQISLNDTLITSFVSPSDLEDLLRQNSTAEPSTMKLVAGSTWSSFSQDRIEGKPQSPEGFAFVAPLIVLSSVTTEHQWELDVVAVLTILGSFGASLATMCCVLKVGVVAARETLSLPPAASGILLMLLLTLLTASTITQAGSVILHLINFYVLAPVVLWPPLLTIISLASCHGINKMRKDMTFMLESRVSSIWVVVWGGLVPFSLLAITIWAFVVSWTHVSLQWATPWQCFLVWMLRVGILFPIPFTAFLVVKSQLAYGLKDKLVAAFQSSREWGDWGPKDPIEHYNWRRWREDETRSYASLERRLVNRPLTYTHSTLSSVGSSTLTRLRGKYRPPPTPII